MCNRTVYDDDDDEEYDFDYYIVWGPAAAVRTALWQLRPAVKSLFGQRGQRTCTVNRTLRLPLVFARNIQSRSEVSSCGGSGWNSTGSLCLWNCRAGKEYHTCLWTLLNHNIVPALVWFYVLLWEFTAGYNRVNTQTCWVSLTRWRTEWGSSSR